jgi:hyaluronan synthase
VKPGGWLVLIGTTVGLVLMWGRAGGPTWYGVAAVSLFAARLLMVGRHRPATAQSVGRPVDKLKIGVAIPVFNEDPAMLAACLESILGQTRRVHSVAVVDDCSNTTAAFEEANRWRERFERNGIGLVVVRQPVNRGKRHALMVALDMQPGIDALLGVDSDTVLERRAVSEIVVPFGNPSTTVATGLVLALNYRRNLLTRLIDLRYSQSFLFDRAAYSSFGSVLCACGSLALYRVDILARYRHDFLTQTFMGRPAIFGDDRRLTNYCLLEGRAVLQESAIAYTAVPERMGHFVRQQIRWNKSFFRESLWVLRAMPVSKPAFWLTFVELGSWIVFTVALVTGLAIRPLVTARFALGAYLVYLALLAWARSFRYVDLTGSRPTRRDRLIGFAIAPLYGILHVGFLVWLRFYSLATLRGGDWGTRRKVEVVIGNAGGQFRPDRRSPRHVASRSAARLNRGAPGFASPRTMPSVRPGDRRLASARRRRSAPPSRRRHRLPGWRAWTAVVGLAATLVLAACGANPTGGKLDGSATSPIAPTDGRAPQATAEFKAQAEREVAESNRWAACARRDGWPGRRPTRSHVAATRPGRLCLAVERLDGVLEAEANRCHPSRSSMV